MSFSLTRSHLTDSYGILSSYNATTDQEEVAIVDALVKGNLTISGNSFTSPANSSVWTASNLNTQYVDTSAISNYPSGTVTKNSVIALEHVTPSELQSYTTDLGQFSGGAADSSQNFTFSMLDSSAPVYDSNFVVTQSYLPYYFDNTVSNDGTTPHGATYRAHFDTSNTNYKQQYAVNSEWVSTPGPYDGFATRGTKPIAVTEASSFNIKKALGAQGFGEAGYGYQPYSSKYARLNTTNGSIDFTDIEQSYQPLSNNLKIVPRSDYTNFSRDNDLGMFRVQQSLVGAVKTQVTLDSAEPDIADPYLVAMPIMDANSQNGILTYATTKAMLNAPGTMNSDQFYSLFNADVFSTVANNYQFNVQINSDNGGYFIDPSFLPSNYLISGLNNDNLLDNPYYMENFVLDNHSINFSDSSLSITPSTNGVQDNIDLISLDLTAGETLTSQYAGVDGQIKINTRTPTTRLTDISTYGTTWSASYVNYTGSDAIGTDMIMNPYVHIRYTKIALRSSAQANYLNGQNVFLESNDAFLTMCTTTYSANDVVNNQVNKSEYSFNFDKTQFTDDNVRIWRINSKGILVADPNSFYSGYDNTNNEAINLVDSISVQSVLQNLVTTLTTYDSYRMNLTAKTLDTLGLTAAVNSTPGWSINYSNDGDTFLHSSSQIAFNDTNSLPNYDMELVNTINNGSLLYFKYEYKTKTTSNTQGGLQDYVDVSYSLNSDLTDATVFTIPQTSLTRTYSGLPSPVITVIDSSQYTILPSIYTSDKWQLVNVVKSSSFGVTFSPNYGIFTNVTLGINEINQVDTYYALQNKTTGRLAPHTALQYISTSIENLYEIGESITLPNSSISGVLNKDDLKGFIGTAEGRVHSNTTWTQISDSIVFDTYYGLDNVNTLTIQTILPISGAPISGADIITNCDFSPFDSATQVVSLNGRNYYIPFEYDSASVSHSLTTFDCSLSTLGQKTYLTEDFNTYFRVEDQYYCVKSQYWLPSGYNLQVDNDSNNVTTFTVTSEQESTVFQISCSSNDIFLGTRIVTYIPKDIWRSAKWVGSNPYDYTQNQRDVIYDVTTYPNNTISFSNVPGIGVTINPVGDILNSSVEFNLPGDFVTVNPVGTLPTNPTSSNQLGNVNYNNGSLSFQYKDNTNTNYSGIITFDRYRGFYEEGVQTYTINRDSTSVTFNVGESLSQVLTTNAYYGENLVVDNLVDSDGNTCANLNVVFDVQYSIPPTGADLVYPVVVQGDSVSVSFTNPEYNGNQTNIPVSNNATPVANPASYSASTDLKTYGRDSMYTFSGIFSETSQLVALRPSRVKMNNMAFSYDSLVYSIILDIPPMYVYRAIPNSNGSGITAISPEQYYLGNPVTIDANDATVEPNPNLWSLIKTLHTSQDKMGGVLIGNYVLKQNEMLKVSEGISYFVSVPPHYKYEIVSTTSSLTHPYDYNNLHSDNKVTVYMPYDESTTEFNPFDTLDKYDIFGNHHQINQNPLYVNNLHIKHLQPKTMLSLTNVETADSMRYGISVPGVKLTIYLYTGLYDSIVKPHLIWDGPITSIPSTLDVEETLITLRNRADDGSVNFSIAQVPTDIGYSSGLSGYQEIFRTDVQSNYYNIDFNIGNVAWYNGNSPVTWFNASATGSRPTLYTVVDINDPTTKVNSRRVYKYESLGTFDIQNIDGLQTLSITFTNGRSYYDVLVNQPNFSNNATNIWQYPHLISNTNIGNLSNINWTSDEYFTDNVYVNWSFGNSVTGGKMPIDLFYIENSEKKFAYITLLPFQSFTNQFGLTVNETSWDGSLYTPLVVTQGVNMQPQLEDPVLSGSTYKTEQYSISALNN